MRGVLIVACTLAALTLAPAAHADVTIGSDLARLRCWFLQRIITSSASDGGTAAPLGYGAADEGAVITACTLAALTLAPAAHAGVTIGSSLAATPDMPPMGPATASQAGVIATSSGVITRWRVKAGSDSSPVRLRVFRPAATRSAGRSRRRRRRVP